MSTADTTAQKPEETDPKKALTKWLLGQEANTIILIGILIAIGYGFYWSATIGIPSHLNQIHKGYVEINEKQEAERIRLMKSCEDQRDREARQHDDARKVDREMYKDALDRIERRSVGALKLAVPTGVAHAQKPPEEDCGVSP